MRNGFIILAALLAATPAAASVGKDTWYLINVSPNYADAVLADVTSLKTLEGSKRSALIELAETVPARAGDVSFISARVIFDCAANTVEVAEATSYDIDDHVVRVSPSEKAGIPVPGSRGEKEIKFVCSDAASWDKSRLINEGSVGGSITDYARFMLQGMMLDAIGAGAIKK